MKYIESKKLSKKKYLLTLEVSDYDIEMLEDLATTYEPFEKYQKEKEKLKPDFELEDLYFTDKFQKWIDKTWKCFWRLWDKHDEI